MWRGPWFLLVAIGMASTIACGRHDRERARSGEGNRETAPQAREYLGERANLASDSLLVAMRPRLGPWTRRWAEVIPGFTLDSLYRLRAQPFRPQYSRRLLPGELRRARYFGETSPDSTRIAEADSYRDIIDGVPELWGEPDSAPALVDLEADSLHILATVGTVGGFEDAHWIDSRRFFITGYGERQYEPWRGGGDLSAYDLESGTLTRYNTPDVGKAAYDVYLRLSRKALGARYGTPVL